MQETITDKQIACFESSMLVSKIFMAVVLGFMFVYFALIVTACLIADYNHNTIAFSLIGAVAVFCSTLLNLWAFFFIILDAQSSQLEIKELIKLSKEQTLSMYEYDTVHNQLRFVNANSSNIADGVALVAYLSMVGFILVLFMYGETEKLSELSGSTNFYGSEQGRIILTFCSALLQSREAVLILLALPHIAEVNELHDQLSSTLAHKEWGESTITPSTTYDSYSVVSSDVISVHKNNLCMRMWAATVDRPLYMYVLGRPIKRVEMKAQLVTVCLVAMGSLLSFLFSNVYDTI